MGLASTKVRPRRRKLLPASRSSNLPKSLCPPQRFREKNMSKRTNIVGLIAFALLALNSAVSAQTNLTASAGSIQPQPVSAVAESDRTRDGLVGPVRRVRTETAKLSN